MRCYFFHCCVKQSKPLEPHQKIKQIKTILSKIEDIELDNSINYQGKPKDLILKDLPKKLQIKILNLPVPELCPAKPLPAEQRKNLDQMYSDFEKTWSPQQFQELKINGKKKLGEHTIFLTTSILGVKSILEARISLYEKVCARNSLDLNA